MSVREQEPDGVLRYRVDDLERRMARLEQKIDDGFKGLNERQDRQTIWLLGALLTITVFLLGIGVTIFATGAGA